MELYPCSFLQPLSSCGFGVAPDEAVPLGCGEGWGGLGDPRGGCSPFAGCWEQIRGAEGTRERRAGAERGDGSRPCPYLKFRGLSPQPAPAQPPLCPVTQEGPNPAPVLGSVLGQHPASRDVKSQAGRGAWDGTPRTGRLSWVLSAGCCGWGAQDPTSWLICPKSSRVQPLLLLPSLPFCLSPWHPNPQLLWETGIGDRSTQRRHRGAANFGYTQQEGTGKRGFSFPTLPPSFGAKPSLLRLVGRGDNPNPVSSLA